MSALLTIIFAALSLFGICILFCLMFLLTKELLDEYRGIRKLYEGEK